VRGSDIPQEEALAKVAGAWAEVEEAKDVARRALGERLVGRPGAPRGGGGALG
jgi:hypothetical protein